jgi:hypothetical protein
MTPAREPLVIRKHSQTREELAMNIRLSVEKDKKVLSSGTYEIMNGTDWENACSDIWRRTRQEQPLNSLDVNKFTSGAMSRCDLHHVTS